MGSLCRSSRQEVSHFRGFLGSTSLHGARFLAEKSILRRVFWFVALAVAFGFCGNQVSKTVKAFLAKPFSTTITRERSQSKIQHFPAVTLCNLNMVSMKQYVLTNRAWGVESNASDHQLRQDIQAFMGLMTYKGSQGNSYLEKTKKQLYSLPQFRQRGSLFAEILAGFSHTPEGMLSFEWLQPCIWRGKQCLANNFSSLLNFKMGQCYTFNSGDKGHPLLENQQIPGPTNGLRLKLNVEEKDHVTNFNSPMAGFKLLIHDQNEYPMVEEFGFAVQPGTHTFAAVSVTKFKNLAAPFKTKCRSPEIPFSKHLGYSYSVHACAKQCLYNYVIEKCHCQPLYNVTPGVELCSMQDVFDCVYPTKYTQLPPKVAKCTNECPEPCEFTKYETKLSYAAALSNSFARTVPSYLSSLDEEYRKQLQNTTAEELQTFMRNNLVTIDIYFEDLVYDFIEQKPVFDDWALLANLGGYTGLFVGMSMLTVLEFIDFLVMWMIAAMREPQTVQDDQSKTNSYENNDVTNFNRPTEDVIHIYDR